MSLPGKFIKLKIPGSSPVCLINDSVGDGLYHLRNSALDGGEALKKFNVGISSIGQDWTFMLLTMNTGKEYKLYWRQNDIFDKQVMTIL